jgi:hypothetical protein
MLNEYGEHWTGVAHEKDQRTGACELAVSIQGSDQLTSS